MALVFVFNFFDFINYYWFTYPIAKRDSYGQNTEIYYQKLAKLSAENRVEPYIFFDDFVSQGEDSRFYEVANFSKPINKWKPGQEVPARSILMTRLGQVDGFKLIGGDLNYKFFERN
jgi:hypothetical protein